MIRHNAASGVWDDDMMRVALLLGVVPLISTAECFVAPTSSRLSRVGTFDRTTTTMQQPIEERSGTTSSLHSTCQGEVVERVQGLGEIASLYTAFLIGEFFCDQDGVLYCY